MIRTVVIENTSISYVFSYKNVKNINLRINQNGEISVSANKRVPLDYIDNFVISNSQAILKSLKKFEKIKENLPTPKEYINGEGFKILGKELTLQIKVGICEEVKIDENFLILTVKDESNFSRKQALFNRFIDNECEKIFALIAGETFKNLQEYSIQMPQIKMRTMKSKWGSCMPTRGIITLNKRLIEFSYEAIEYVVLHEFCHLIHPNHSKDFYSLVSSLMPDYKERKKLLEYKF